MADQQQTTYDILGYCVYLPGTHEPLYFWVRKFEEFLNASESPIHKMLLENGNPIDRAVTTPNGEFLVQDGKKAASMFGLARVTYLQENTSPIHIPESKILKA